MKSIVWFRNDLRIKDHLPLSMSSEKGEVLPVYCFDPRNFADTSYGFPKTDSIRALFLIESVTALREKLNGKLVVRLGKPEVLIPRLADEFRADAIYYHEEVTAEEREVETALDEALNLPVYKYHGHSLYHPDDLPISIDDLPEVFTQFRKLVEKRCDVRQPFLKADINNVKHDIDPGRIPELKDLGLEPVTPDERSVLNFKGGEDEAWNRLQHYFFESNSLKVYKFTRNGLLGADYSSKFSPWLAHGCISARSIYKEVEKYEKEVLKNVSTYWMKFELIWRDYFRFSAMKHGNKIFHAGGIQNKEIKKSKNKSTFWKWANGQTGIPFIDANMRELNKTGFMSNRGRQNVASFLAQNLNFDWRWGAAYFESKLVDYDVCSNWGNWAYNATVGHDPRNRYFNILNQAGKYDKKGEYVRYWLPELKNVPAEFIHEPHLMSSDQQNLFGDAISHDYPEPMIDLEKSYEEIRKRGD